MSHPPMDTAEIVELVCPRCRGPLAASPEAYVCAACEGTYPIVSGIPDFRVAPDPWIGLEADRAKGMRLEQETAGGDFAAMVRAYWDMTPETPRALADRYVAHVLGAEARSREWLGGMRTDGVAGRRARWLDLGCGTADLASAAWPAADVVGIDVAFRWLVVARRRLVERRIPARLVCCNAEALPFRDAAFDVAFSAGTVEHCRDLTFVAREARRVLVRGGALHVRTVNRYSVLPEPHVGVWGLGFLPRRWADGYSRLMSGRPYVHHWPRSARELRRTLLGAGFGRVRVEAARLLTQEAQRLAPTWRPALAAYETLRRLPIARAGCRWLAPLLDAEARAG